MENEDEQILVLYLDKGDAERAFRLLIQTYKERLYNHIRGIVIGHDDADDVLQNVFVKVWNNLSGFKNNSSLYTWLYRIATNEALSFLKRNCRRNQFSGDLNDWHLDLAIASDNLPNAQLLLKQLNSSIAALPERQRAVFNLRYFDELKFVEIAEVMEVSVGAVKASYHHAAKKVEAQLVGCVDLVG